MSLSLIDQLEIVQSERGERSPVDSVLRLDWSGKKEKGNVGMIERSQVIHSHSDTLGFEMEIVENLKRELAKTKGKLEKAKKEAKEMRLMLENERLQFSGEKGLQFLRELSHFGEIGKQGNKLDEKREELMKEIQKREEIIKRLEAEKDKNQAIFSQKCEFYEAQIESLKDQVHQRKMAHDSLIRNLEIGPSEAESKRRINDYLEIKDAHRVELKQLHETFQKLSQGMKSEIEELTQKNKELLVQLDNLPKGKGENSVDSKENQEVSFRNAKELEKMEKELRNTRKFYEEEIKRIRSQNQEEIQQNRSASLKEIEETRKTNEIRLNELRFFYENEKTRMEAKMNSEISRIVAREEKSKEMEDSVTSFMDSRKIKEEQLFKENEKDKKIQEQTEEIENLRREIKKLNSEAQKSMMDLPNERELKRSIENLRNEIGLKGMEIKSLKERVENLGKTIRTKDSLIERLKEEHEQIIEEYDGRLVESRKKFQKAVDELVERKIEFCKELGKVQEENERLKRSREKERKNQDLKMDGEGKCQNDK